MPNQQNGNVVPKRKRTRRGKRRKRRKKKKQQEEEKPNDINEDTKATESKQNISTTERSDILFEEMELKDATKKHEIKMFECNGCDRPCYDCIQFWCFNCQTINDEKEIDIKTIYKFEKINILDQYEPKEGLEFLVWGFIRLCYENYTNDAMRFITMIVPTSIKLLCCQYYFIMDSKILPITHQFALLKQILCQVFVKKHSKMSINLLLKMGDNFERKIIGKKEFSSIIDNKPSLLVIIQSNRDHIFGFYVEKQWKDYYTSSSTYNGKKISDKDESFAFLLSDNDKLKPKIFRKHEGIVAPYYQQSYWGGGDPFDMYYIRFGRNDIDLLVPIVSGIKCTVRCNGTAFHYTDEMCGDNAHSYSRSSGMCTFRVNNIEIYQLLF